MLGVTDESVGENFSESLLQMARDKTLAVIERAREQVRPGISENEARALVQQVQSDLGAPKSWHPAQIRFGPNTALPFGRKGVENPVLQRDDIFFFDIGPVFAGHEGDVGRAYSVGQNSEFVRCCRDVEEIWFEVQMAWLATRKHVTELTDNLNAGKDLYDYAAKCAQKRGWLLNLEKANGHRIADFPHIAKARGSIENFPGLPASNRWILEIQIKHPTLEFGAFYEDLLG